MNKTQMMAVVGCLISAPLLNAADTPAKETASFLSKIYTAPIGVYNIPNLHDEGQWGAGIEVGVDLSQYVSLGLQNVSYAGDNNWGGYIVDETSLVVHTTLLRSESLVFALGVDAAGVRDWNKEDWAFGVGPRVDVFFSENISLSGGTQIRAYMKEGKALYNYASLNFGF